MISREFKKLLKTAQTMYLYSDGHAMICHEKADTDAGRVYWVTAHESIHEKSPHLENDGRLIISGPEAIAMALSAERIRARAASTESGSENTKKAGIAVGHIAFNFGHGYVYFSTFPDLVSSAFTYQAKHAETWEDVKNAHIWHIDERISKHYPKEAPKNGN